MKAELLLRALLMDARNTACSASLRGASCPWAGSWALASFSTSLAMPKAIDRLAAPVAVTVASWQPWCQRSSDELPMM
ncbi:hypothetical protein D9M70_596470 [compost metagenome]